MNSTVSDDLTRDHLALETAKCLKNIHSNSRNITVLHKELLEINLSVTTYIEESKRRLAALRGDLAHEAKSSRRVVEILSNKCKKMSTSLPTPINNSNPTSEENACEVSLKFNIQHARSFVTWYCDMIDNKRQKFSLYLSDDAILEWFGRTIKTRKKISGFLNHDVQCSRHHFTSIEIIEKIQWRQERPERADDSILASPLHSPEMVRSKPGKRRHSQVRCVSPQWAEGCHSDDEANGPDRKRLKKNKEMKHIENTYIHQNNILKPRVSDRNANEISNDGDGAQGQSKSVLVTPPNVERGQGDCLPSTSGTDSDRSHEALNAQLPRLAVECNGYIEFPKSRSNGVVSPRLKWERKCKVQISYSDDPLNVGEYIIWAVRYHDENKCRRNLLDEFEKVSKDEKS